jgi:hypothetical protein
VHQLRGFDEARHHIQGCSDEPISGRVNGEIVKPTEYFTPVEQLARLGGKDIDTTTYARENHLAITVTASEIALEPVLNGLGKQARHEVRQVIAIRVHESVELTLKPRELRCVEHQEPEISNRDAADQAVACRRLDHH